MIWVLSIFVILGFAFMIYINSRLFEYIRGLENKIIEKNKLLENLQQSLKELVQDGFLLNDGRLKKFIMQNERNKIYNGIKIEEQEVNF